jgi:hypothetical protein
LKIPDFIQTPNSKTPEAENGLGIGDLYIITYQNHKE